MAGRSFVQHFKAGPDAVWAVLADTARFNEAAGLPKHDIEEIAQDDGSVLYLGRGKVGPFSLSWRERPVNWVAPRWFEHHRDFERGPLRRLSASLTLTPEGAGCRADYRIEAEPANLLGRLLLAAGFLASAGRTFSRLAADTGAYLAGTSATPFRYAPPLVSTAVRDRVDALVTRIDDSRHGHGLPRKLADFLLSAQEVDLVRVRPLRLARHWDVPRRHAVELCLEAARAGLLELRWDLLCPRCRIAKSSVLALDQLPRGAHCSTCNIDYQRDYAKNVEVSFTPSAQVRPIDAGEYCLFGPISTPHIWVQVTLAPGERRSIDVTLPPGTYRLRTLEPGPEAEIEFDGERFPALTIERDAVRTGENEGAGTGRLVARNETPRPRTLIVEELGWARDALTADRVTALQVFRDLFSDQVLRPGDEVAIRRIAFLFTDLRGSTALYGEIGDAAAYNLVREHFAVLAAIVRDHEGAVVKTIGDAIMAAFAEPADAVRAALAMRQKMAEAALAEGEAELILKVGVHLGPTIAVAMNDQLDYFGSTVNMAARLQAQSHGGDIVLSQEIALDPGAREVLDGIAIERETVALKGFAEPVPFLRVPAEDRSDGPP